jgi:hypothetical protein
MSKEAEKIILSPEEDEFRIKMVTRFERELRFIKHRGMRTGELSAMTVDEVENSRDIFMNCIDRISFLKDTQGKIVGWQVKESVDCEEVLVGI